MGPRAFRNYHVAAPLKETTPAQIYDAIDAFRNYHVAAPLKAGERRDFRRGDRLPQLSCCGPIEGAHPTRATRQSRPSATIMLRPH